MVESQNETNKPPVLALKQGVCLFQANMNGQHQRQYTPLTGKSSLLDMMEFPVVRA